MTGILFLAWKHALHHRARTIMLVLCVSVAVAIPLATTILVERHQADLVARADVTPLVAGARANRFDLALGALYFRQAELRPIPLAACDEMREFGVVIPLNIQSTVQGIPVVATVPEYFERRRLKPRAGSLPLLNGDVVLGADAARILGLGEGDHLFSDPIDLYDISKPSSLRMLVTGVLRRTGTPDDDVVFTDIDTAWIMQGLAHGHAAEVDEDLVMARSEDVTIISPRMVEYNEITDENASSFHLHADENM
ncbi:MAG: hypothetical protein KDA28_16510, partial [Phycisphaerales bacterium]|nr:hypothetical protein [Phycisphaerales bacterium]